jgi:hypothetical protein
MNAFVDPREPLTSARSASSRATPQAEDLAELHQLCREGRLYEIEAWIKDGRPLQLSRDAAARSRRSASALALALVGGSHSLALLLLANGYDPNLERGSPLDIALGKRRWDLVDLLLDWGADPHGIDPEVLFETYQSTLFERLWDFGVDFTSGYAVAEFLAEHPGAKPLLGFARRHRGDPRIQRELDVALTYHAGRGNEKGVQLCMWAGGNPHTPACNLRYPRPCAHTAVNPAGEDGEEEEDEYSPEWSAIEEACRAGHVALLRRLKPNPQVDDFDELYQWARDRYVIEYLMSIAPPRDPEGVLQHHFWRLGWWGDEWRATDALRALFEAGLRWTSASTEAAAGMRHILRKLNDDTFIEVVALLAKSDYCAPEILKEIGRTPSMRKRFEGLGYLEKNEDLDDRGRWAYRYRPRPTHATRVARSFGVEPPKPTKQAPRRTPAYTRIGPARRNGQEMRLTRKDLYERVWATPVAKLAAEWGISGPGLKKACKRLGVPVPPRGYWARREAGHRPRRPRLSAAPPGASDTIIVTLPVVG